MKKNAIVSAILKDPAKCQEAFNAVVSGHKHIVKGRMGLPDADGGLGLIAIAVKAEDGEIAAFVKELSAVDGVVANSVVA